MSPPARPISMPPIEVRSSADPVAERTRMSPIDVFARMRPTWSRAMSPAPASMSTVSSAPSTVMSPQPRTSRVEPAGTATSRSTRSPPPKSDRSRARVVRGERITRRPSAKSTVVPLASSTSAARAGLCGRRSTVVSGCSPACRVRVMPETSMTAEMGCGVAKVGMVTPVVWGVATWGWWVAAGAQRTQPVWRWPVITVVGAMGGGAEVSTRELDRPHEPGVDRHPGRLRGLLDLGFEPLGKSQAEAGRAAVPASSPPSGVVASGVADGVTAPAAGVTAKSTSRPRRRTSTDPGARSRVISPAASTSASRRTSRIDDSSPEASRSATAIVSSPPLSAVTRRSRWSLAA